MLTVLLATKNGASTLATMLESCCRLDVPPGGWKLVIVDNGSTDRTKEVVTAYLTRLPLTLLSEAVPGKNVALNTGLAAIDGDLVVLTDDDIVPNANWLVQMRAAADAHPEFSIFGGTVLPRWEQPPPDWVLAYVPLGPAFAISDSALREGPVAPGLVFGPNMAVRAEVFRQGFRFDPSIGPKGRSYPMGSETEFLYRLSSAGNRAWHCPAAIVEHFVRAFQLVPRWLYARAVRFGRGEYRLEARHSPAFPHAWFGVPRHLIRELAAAAGERVSARVFGNAERRVKARWQYHVRFGCIVEARHMHRESLRPAGAPALPRA